jgi:hypothetical protein
MYNKSYRSIIFVLFLRLSQSQNRARVAYFNIKLRGKSSFCSVFSGWRQTWSQLFQMELADQTGALMQRWSIEAIEDAELRKHQRSRREGSRS